MALDKEMVVKVANCIVNKINNECYYILVLKLLTLNDKCFTAIINRKRGNPPDKMSNLTSNEQSCLLTHSIKRYGSCLLVKCNFTPEIMKN